MVSPVIFRFHCSLGLNASSICPYSVVFQSSNQVSFLLRSPAWPHTLWDLWQAVVLTFLWLHTALRPCAVCVWALSLLPDLEWCLGCRWSASLPSQLCHQRSMCPWRLLLHLSEAPFLLYKVMKVTVPNLRGWFFWARDFPGGTTGKESACQYRTQEMQVQSLGQEGTLK